MAKPKGQMSEAMTNDKTQNPHRKTTAFDIQAFGFDLSFGSRHLGLFGRGLSPPLLDSLGDCEVVYGGIMAVDGEGGDAL